MSTTWVQIACFGDSIVHGGCDDERGGWVTRLRCDFARRGLGDHVFNLGLGGDSSRDIRGRLADEMRARLGHVDRVLVSCGTNDVLFAAKRTSEDEYRDNIQDIVGQVRRLGKQPILCTVTPWDPARNAGIGPEQLARRLRGNDFIRGLCASEGILCLDLAEAFPLCDLVDGVHPGPAGHERIYGRVRDGLVAAGVVPPG